MKHPSLMLKRRVLLYMLAVGLPSTAFSQHNSLPEQLVGHWRTTIIMGDSPLDRHLVLKNDGTATRWNATAQRRDPPETGTWSTAGKTLVLGFRGEVQQTPYTLHNGQLVLPNIANRRRFWDRL